MVGNGRNRTRAGASIALAAAGALVAATLSGCRTADTRDPAESLAETSDILDQAKMLRASGRAAEALEEFERALEINPNLSVAYLGVADIYREEGNLAGAAQNYGYAASVEPTNFDAHFNQGLMLHLLDRLRDAARAYLRALALRPADVEANLNVATAFFQMGEPAQGVQYAERAAELDPTNGPALVNLAAIYAATGRHTDAINAYRLASEHTELTPPLLLNLAQSQIRAGRSEEAITTIDRVIKIEPSAIAYERLGAARFRAKDYEGSLGAFRDSLETDESHYPAWNGVGVVLLNEYLWSDREDIESLRSARRALSRSLQIEPRQATIRELLTRYR